MWDAVKAIWAGLDPPIQAALIGAISTVGAGLLAALVVVWQIGKQARLAIDANRHTEGLKLKLKVYQSINESCRKASSVASDAYAYIHGFQLDVGIYRSLSKQGLPWQVPEARTSGFREKTGVLSEAGVELLGLIESWQAIDPRIQVFQRAIGVALNSINSAFHSYLEIAVLLVPYEAEGSSQTQRELFPWHPPDDQAAEKLETRWNALSDALLELQSYVYDIRIETQNLLVGGLFGTRVRPRQPTDPDIVVVRLDQYDELMAHFDKVLAQQHGHT